jgi:hypothetical protein
MWEVVAQDRNRGFNAPDYFRERDFETGIMAEPLSSRITEDIQEQTKGLWN